MGFSRGVDSLLGLLEVLLPAWLGGALIRVVSFAYSGWALVYQRSETRSGEDGGHGGRWKDGEKKCRWFRDTEINNLV